MKIDMPLTGVRDALGKVPAAVKPAVAAAINQTRERVNLALVAEMKSVFDRPTPWALNALKSEKATPNRLEATVRIKGKADSGSAVPPESFLRAEIEGGQRRFKRFEISLYRKGLLEQGWYAVPGAGAKRDAYGNMTAGHISQILSFFQAFVVASSGRRLRNNMTDATRAKRLKSTARRRGTEYFYVPVGSQRHTKETPGVYERIDFGAWGKAIRPVIIFVRKAAYRPRFRFKETAKATVDQHLQGDYQREMGAALGPGGRL